MPTMIPYLVNPDGTRGEMWSITTGCGDDMVSPGCLNCYARRMFGRNLWKCPTCDGSGVVFDLRFCPTCHGTGTQDFTPTFHADRLEQPLHWRKPRRIGVSFMGDLFHEAITDEQIFGVWSQIALCPDHTLLVLTKRPKRMQELIGDPCWHDDWSWTDSPLPNVHLGVTVCNQEEADRNIPILLDTPAAVRWVSLEPMLGPVDLRGLMADCDRRPIPTLDWVVLGGETGPGARPMQPEWPLDVYRQCRAAGVPFWFKSMGTAPHKKVWDWSNTLGAEMQATHELPGVTS